MIEKTINTAIGLSLISTYNVFKFVYLDFVRKFVASLISTYNVFKLQLHSTK